MKNIRGAAVLAGIVAGALTVGGTTATAQTVASLPTGTAPAAVTGEARPVYGWVEFCQRQPQECAFDPAEPAAVAINPKTWQTIVSVNRKVNATIQAVTDQEHWGVPDRWDLPTDGYGDCEDFQLLKRKLLA